MVVAGRHHEAVGPCVERGDDVALLDERQHALLGEDVAAFANVADDALFDEVGIRLAAIAENLDVVERVVHGGTHKHVETEVGTHVTVFAVELGRVYGAEQHAALRDDVTAGFDEELAFIAGFLDPCGQQCVKPAAEFGHIKAGLFLILAVGDAEAASEVDDLDAGEQIGEIRLDEVQQEFDGVEIIVRLHEQRTDVLVHPGERQAVLFEQGADLIQ